MLTDRDKNIIVFVEKFKAVKTSQIKRKFFQNTSESACRRRLGLLCDKYKLLKKEFRGTGQENTYYVGRPLRYPEHRLKLVDFYLACEKYDIKRFDVEPVYGKVIPDAYAEIGIGKDTYLFFIEVHMSYGYQKFDQGKYEDLYQGWTGKYFPRVVIISEKSVQLESSQIKYIVLRDGYKISEIFK